ncbi:hypothetical protein [Listeria aquatica]|uniref:hypothetical protein n=1 Tax=Listeria aquatica TaxID=1494960 RepID=UPI0031F4B3D3
MKKFICLMAVFFLLLSTFVNSAVNIVHAADYSTITSGALTYDEGKSGIVATKDWATVNLKLNLVNLKKGESLTLELNSEKYGYSKEPFKVGDVLITPNANNTWTITAEKDIPSGNISLNLKLRYQESTTKSLVDPIRFTLKDGGINLLKISMLI